MANLFLNLPAPAANAAGAGVDVSAMGSSKSVVIGGSWGLTLTPIITIEINNDPAQLGSWVAIGSTQGGGTFEADVCCRWMRARVSGYQGGPAPTVNVGSDDGGTQFAALDVPAAANGPGTWIDVSALPGLKTIQVGGVFQGAVIIEVSEDGTTSSASLLSFQAPGLQTLPYTAHWVRARRVGVPVIAPGTPVVNIGACSIGGGSSAGVLWAAGAGVGSVVQNNSSGNQAPGADAFASGSGTNASGNSSSTFGEGAVATRETQSAHASGMFAVPGDALSSMLEMLGLTPGIAPGESVELKFGALRDQVLQLQDGRGYLIEVSAVAKDTIAGGKGVQCWNQRYAVRRAAGLTTIAAVGAVDQYGDPASAAWTVAASVGAAPDRFQLTFTTTGAQAAARCVAGLRFIEVLNA